MTITGGLPKPVKVEIEWTAGVWTDVTAEIDSDIGYELTAGRTSPLSQPQPATATVTFRNLTGLFTPGRQVLTDGTAATFYPNVAPGRRIRFSYTAASTVYTRFQGNILSFVPVTDGSGHVTGMRVDALDLPSRLASLKMAATNIRQEILTDSPSDYWPLTDAAGTTYAGSAVGGQSLGPTGQPFTPVLTFGGGAVGQGEGTSASFGTTQGSQGYVNLPGTNAPFTLEAWVQISTTPSTTFPVLTMYSASGIEQQINIDPTRIIYGNAGGGSTLTVGKWAHVAVTSDGVSSGTLYVNGVNTGSAGAVVNHVYRLVVGWYSAGASTGVIGVGHVAVYQSVLSAARVLAHYNAGIGWAGETSSQRIARYLTYAGLTSASWNLDPSTVILDTAAVGGQDIMAACLDVAASESGGAALYVTGSVVRFVNRDGRRGRTVKIPVDAEADLAGDVFAPSTDSLSLINAAEVTAVNASGSGQAVRWLNQPSINLYGIQNTGGAVNSFDASPDGRRFLAQWLVAQNATPGYRLPQVSIDLVNAATDLWSAAGGSTFGQRIRISNMPPAAAASTVVDVIIEGWKETVTTGSYRITWDTSPADNPAFGVFDDTELGRWQCDGQTLSAALTATATTVVIATGGGKPVLSTTGASYPMNIQVGAEVITLNGVPGGSTSPQTFTGVTRGTNGTTASAQSSGAAVALWPLASYAL